jgi:hypothetical protein
MHLYKPQMTSAEFNAAFREAGFGVAGGRIVDVSGKCPGFATFAASHGRGVLNRNATLARLQQGSSGPAADDPRRAARRRRTASVLGDVAGHPIETSRRRKNDNLRGHLMTDCLAEHLVQARQCFGLRGVFVRSTEPIVSARRA